MGLIKPLKVLAGAWRASIRPPSNGRRVVVTRPDMAGLRGRIFNPLPLLDGRWVIELDQDNPTDGRFSSYFQELHRWEFVVI